MYFLFTGYDVGMQKTVPEVSKAAHGRRPFSRARAQFFASVPKVMVNNVFIF